MGAVHGHSRHLHPAPAPPPSNHGGGGAAGGGDHARAGTRRSHGHRLGLESRVSGDQCRVGGGRRGPAAGSDRGQRSEGPAGALWRCRLRAADRVRERRQPAPRPRHGPAARNGGTGGSGCRAGAHRSHAPGGKPGTRVGGRGHRVRAGVLGCGPAPAAQCGRDPAGPRGGSRRRRIGVRGRDGAPRDRRLWLVPGRGPGAGGCRPAPRRGGGGARGLRARGGLVAAEVAIAMVLLVGAGLLIRSFWTLRNVDPGFRTDGALAVSLVIPSSRYLERERYLAAHDQILERLRAIPGVEVVGSIRNLPMRGAGESILWEVVGEPAVPLAQRPSADVLQVTPDLFRALGVPLLRGRTVAATDPPAGARAVSQSLVLVVNETFARKAFRGADPLGRAIRVDGGDEGTIVGLVGDVHQRALETPPAPTIYVPLQQAPRRAMTFVIRTAGDPLAVAPAAHAAIREVDPRQAITELTSLDAVVHGSIARPRFFTVLLTGFAALAIALAVVGIYAVLAFAVQQRTREIGIRIALGAERRGTLRLVLRQGMTPVLAGVAAGLLAAAGLTRGMTGILFEIRPFDPGTYGVAALAVAGVALLACWIPGHRATRVEPMEALRYE